MPCCAARTSPASKDSVTPSSASPSPSRRLWNALRQRDRLQLDILTVFDARAGVRRHLLSVVIGLLSMGIALAAPIKYLSLAGLIFMLMGPARGAFGYWNGRARERLESSASPPWRIA